MGSTGWFYHGTLCAESPDLRRTFRRALYCTLAGKSAAQRALVAGCRPGHCNHGSDHQPLAGPQLVGPGTTGRRFDQRWVHLLEWQQSLYDRFWFRRSGR